jgi:hypothetical protein
MRPRRGILIACASLLCCVAHPSGQARPRELRPAAGIVAFDVNPPVPLKLLELGVGLVRGSCSWANLEPARGEFDWTCADNVIAGAEHLGMRSYMTVTCTPDWANEGRGCREMPASLNDWYVFVANFVGRYASFHTVLGVWNEPNLELNDDPSGENYALLFINASNARNAVAPSLPIAGPETSHHALQNGYLLQTLDTIQSNHAFEAHDILAVHWYEDGPPLPDYLDTVHDFVKNQELWLTETGTRSTDPEAQAQFYRTVLSTFSALGRRWWTHVIFYRLWDGTDCCSEAILQSDYSPKAAFRAYQRWVELPYAVPRQ